MTPFSSVTILVPPSMESRASNHAPYRKQSTGEEIDDVVVPQVDCRKDEAADDREKEIEKIPFEAIR
jgi:hypothetical protein